jgi:hypothetical protein
VGDVVDEVTVLSGTAQTVEAQTVTVKESAVGKIVADAVWGWSHPIFPS